MRLLPVARGSAPPALGRAGPMSLTSSGGQFVGVLVRVLLVTARASASITVP